MSEISKQALKVDNNTSFPNNNTGYISPSILRAFNVNMIDSLVDEITFTAFSSSVTSSIQLLNAYTASIQPSFTSLNQFTASQLTINTGYNQYTQSTDASIASLQSEVDNIQIWTASVNEISFNNSIPNYATRWNFRGFISASFVENVGGRIADIDILNDPSKLNTSSFNDYTASTAATQTQFSASVATSISQSSATFTQFSQSQNNFNLSATASLQELLNLSSSLSGGYATQGELDQSASVLQSNIDTKLNTSSFNDYTQSFENTFNQYTSSQGLLNVTFATTGSNQFNGNQVISGSVTISGSATSDLTVVGQIFVSSSATGGTTAPRITVSGSAGQTIIQRNLISSRNLTNTAQLNPAAIFAANITTLDEIGFTVDPVAGGVSGWNLGPSIYVNNDPGDTYPAVFGFQNKANYTDGRVTVLTPLVVNKATTVSGSLTITGSVYQNVSQSVINASTTSIDLSVANYFKLTLSGSTNINVINAQPGVTATLVINTDTGASASFSSNVKQPSGSFYVASPSGNIDIISFTAVDSTTVYAFPAQSFV